MMSQNKLKEFDIKNCTCFYDNIININILNPKNINVDQKSDTNTFIYYIGYVASNGVKPLYNNINKINGYIEGNNGSKYLITPIHENKGKLKKYEEI